VINFPFIIQIYTLFLYFNIFRSNVEGMKRHWRLWWAMQHVLLLAQEGSTYMKEY